MSLRVKLPSPAIATAGIALVFGRDAFFLTLLFVFAVFSIAGLDKLLALTGYAQFTWQASIRAITIAMFAIGLAGQYLLTGRTILSTPRGISTTIAILVLVAIWSIIAFTDVDPIVKLIYGKTYEYWRYLVHTYFGNIAPALLLTLAIYMLVLPRVARWIINSRVDLVVGGFLASLITLVFSLTSLEIVFAIRDQLVTVDPVLQGALWLVVALAGFFELRRILVEGNAVELLMQLPAIYTIVVLGLNYLGPEVKSGFMPWLTFMALAFHFIAVLGIAIGLAGNNRRAFVVGSVILTAMSAVAYSTATALSI